ncbi:clathrin associated protein complex large subunit [Hypoxylon texense]
MPSFRGIEIFVVTGSEARKLPEYPHPDGPSVRLMRVGAGVGDLRTRSQASHQSSPSSCSSTDPTRQKKVNPRISVYIPSCPGDQFRLRYLISESSPPSRYVFFKMYINRHHTVSWGVDSNRYLEGSVSRSLYQPGDLHGGRNGVAAAGTIETRYFHFMHGLDKKSIAEDGGVIEVQVFRCRGRKRVAVELNPYPHRHQERYGVTSPSGGLVDNPQDATFYEYHLEDSRDSPYATFCFHYRSMKYLEQLNIVPQQEVGFRSTPIDPPGIAASDSQEGSARATSPASSHQFTFGIEPLDTRVFDNDTKAKNVTISEASGATEIEEYFLRSPPQLSPLYAVGVSSEDAKQVQKGQTMAELLHRPLPELPKTRPRAASGASVWSACPSLTPSLKQYAEGEEFENEEIQLCTAQSAVFVQSESMQALDASNMNPRGHGDSSCSNYEDSSNYSETSQSPALPSPGGYVSTTGSVLERDLDQWDSPIAQSSPKSKAQLPTSKSKEDLLGNVSLLSAGTLKVTESEWLRQTPSPRGRRANLFKRLWSPRPGTQSGRSSMVELPGCDNGGPKSAGSSKETISEGSCTRNNKGIEHIDETPQGNWI